MKVLLITGDFPPARSGEAAHAFHLALNIARRGVEVHVLTTFTKDIVKHPELKVHPLMPSWSWAEVPRFAAFLRRCSPDAILLLYLGAMYDFHPMITFTPTIAKHVLPSVPFVTQFENPTAPNWNARLLTKAFRKLVVHSLAREGSDYTFGTLLHDSKRVIVLCGMHKGRLDQHQPQISEKCILVPPPPFMEVSSNNGKTRAEGRALLGVEKDEFLLIYFGYIYPGKGLETLLKAIRIVKQNERKFRLLIVGGFITHFHAKEFNAETQEYCDSIFDLQDTLGVTDRIIWVGHVRQDKITLYLRAADLCVLPFDKGVHLNNSSFAAAAAHGLPTITTKSAELDQQFVHLQNVFLCPPKDPEAMAYAILSLLDNPDLCKHLSLGALQLAEEWFSWESAIKHTIETLELDR